MSESADKPPKCPDCGSDAVQRIVYGYPSEETLERAGRGEFQLGGCIVTPENPDWHCKACDHAWVDRSLDLPWRERD